MPLRLNKAKVLVGVAGDFHVKATATANGNRFVGWRITTTNQESSLQHEFFVCEGRIHHILFQSAALRNDQTPFVMGGRVKRILDAERWAILKTIGGLLVA